MRTTLLDRIPDTPEWVEARCALLRGGEAFGAVGAAMIVTPERDMAFVVGRPSRDTVARALAVCADDVEILAREADADHASRLLESSGAAAILHVPGDAGLSVFRASTDYEVAVTNPADLDAVGHIDAALREELSLALARTPVLQILVDGRPISFCYAGAETERWWDVSIDTLEPYRRRGFAAAAFRALDERMRRQGKPPLWGAYVSNEASRGLARKLGFRPYARVFVWAARDGRYGPADEE